MQQGGAVNNAYNNEGSNGNITIDDGVYMNVSEMRVTPYPSVSAITTGTSTATDSSIMIGKEQQQFQNDDVQNKTAYIYNMALYGNLPIDYKGVEDAIRSLPNDEVLKKTIKVYLEIGKTLENVLLEQKKYFEYLIEKNVRMKKMFSRLFKKEKDRRQRIQNRKIQKQN